MGKQKYENYGIKHIVGILDKDENDDDIVIVDSVKYLLTDVLENLYGQEIEIKSQYTQE
ncbi:MAG: hypothetical protein RSD67_02415 [Oscillospiraceae bacterium]